MKALTNLLSAGNNQWTGGQYSIFRASFGAYLFAHFVHLLPWGTEIFSDQGALPDGGASPVLYLFPNIFALFDSPAFVTGVLALAAGLSILLAVGRFDRCAAVGLWYIWACLFGRNPLIANPGLPYVGLLLLAHAFLPPAPYGSWERRKETDPGSDWRMPQSIYLVVWILMCLGYTYSGYTKLMSPSWVDGTALERVLNNPLARPGIFRDLTLMLPPAVLSLMTWGTLALELLYAPMALFGRIRPWIWAIMLSMHLGLILLIDFADLSLGMVMLHLFTFNPGWIKPLAAKGTDRVFYDGACGLCHRAVRFLLAEDRDGTAFRFAPLNGEAIEAAVPEEQRASLPDSMVVVTAGGEVLVKSRAWLHIMQRLGGVWRVIGAAARLIPEKLRDAAYDFIAAIRGRLFRPAEAACPILPKHLRARFDY